MVPLRRVPHDRCMGRHRDEKLRIIAESVAGRGCSHRELYELGRAGDLIDCPAGGTFHTERDASRWAYLLISGDVAVSQHGRPVAVAAKGSWFPLHEDDRTTPSRTSLTALGAAQLLAFRAFEVSPALDAFLAVAR